MKKILSRIQNYLEHYGKIRTREMLLSLSERQLADTGISRELLLQGVSAWPWRAEETAERPQLASVSVDQSVIDKREYKNAYRELQNMSDRELLDLGISRGNIHDAILHGVEDKAA